MTRKQVNEKGVWFNIGVVCSVEDSCETFIQAMKDLGLSEYNWSKDGGYLTTYSTEYGTFDIANAKGVAKDNLGEDITALLIVVIDEDANQVEGEVFEVSDGELDLILRDVFEGDFDSWDGISYESVTVDATVPDSHLN